MQFWVWLLVFFIVIGIITFWYIFNLGMWFHAMKLGAHVSFKQLLSISSKKLDARYVIDNYARAKKSGIKISVSQIENHIQTFGDIEGVINALIAAKYAGLNVESETAIAIDLSGRDIIEVINKCITPQTVQINNIKTSAKSGHEISVSLRVTLRLNFNRVLGGAIEDTIIARVRESVITIIGNTNNYSVLIEKPELISKSILLNRGLFFDTAFDIISVNVIDIKLIKDGNEIESFEDVNFGLKNFINEAVNKNDKSEENGVQLKKININFKKYIRSENKRIEDADTNNLSPYINTLKKKTKLQ